jgi:hypothetical protein
MVMATASLVKTSTHTARDWGQRAGEGSSGTLSGKLGMVLVTLSTSNIPPRVAFKELL